MLGVSEGSCLGWVEFPGINMIKMGESNINMKAGKKERIKTQTEHYFMLKILWHQSQICLRLGRIGRVKLLIGSKVRL